MHRRDFSRGIVVALIGIPAARLLAACGGSMSNSNSTAPVADLAPPVAAGPGPDGGVVENLDLATSEADMAMGGNTDLATFNAPDLSPSTITYTSTIDSAHTHQVTIEVSLYQSPPSGGVMRVTTTDLNHSHVVTLTHAQLVAIANGTLLTVPTGVSNNHSHCFHFVNHA